MAGIVVKIAILLAALIFSGCAPNSAVVNSEYPVYASYRDIPGITEREIAAIEALRENRERFVYGMEQSTECFPLEDGISGGYAALLCEYFTELFGIPFVPELYEWGELLDGLAAHRVDFSGDLTSTPDRLKTYRMTGPIAVRTVKRMRVSGSRNIEEIAEARAPRYVFLEGTTTYDQVTKLLKGEFEIALADDYDTVYRMLKNGEADAFFDEGPFEAAFDSYGDIIAEDFFPPIYGPVSLCTQNPELEPVVTVVQKALENGALRYFAELYNQGYRDYLKHKFLAALTEEEKGYIQSRAVSGEAVPVGLEYDNYPMCFFNTRDKEFQGIAVDVLAEIERLTGLHFAPPRPGLIHWSDMLDMLDSGETALVSEMIPTAEREGRYLWPKTSYLTDHYALLSRSDYKDITVNEILYSKIGLTQDTGYTLLFHEWFPNHAYTVMYSDNLIALDALERGEVDLIMSTQNQLLSATNYLEKFDFKANIVFDTAYESTFGFNRNEGLLCSIVEKAMALISPETITDRWTHRAFDYQSAMTRSRMPYLIGVSALLLCVAVLLSIMFLRSRRIGKDLEAAVNERTQELAAQTEIAVTASEAKSTFLARMSHEIRTPMNAIIGMAEILLRRDIPAEAREEAANIKQAGTNLLSIINDILDFSKIESGKMEIVSEDYHLASVINDCINIIRMRLDDSSVKFLVNVDTSLPGVLKGDAARLRQILLNLLTNAVKYTHEGSISLTVGEKRDIPMGNGKCTLVFTVTDTGIGIKDEDIGKLFGEFQQFDKRQNQGIEGTGLGLAITRNLCHLMDGDITVSSVYGKGSTFSVFVPQEVRDFIPIGNALNDGSAGISAEKTEVRFTAPAANILAVDDIVTNLDVIKGLLALYQTDITGCTTGEDAIQLVQENNYDIVFMDHMMPGMDGIEAAKRIRALGQSYKDLTIIILTANAVSGMKEMFLAEGFNDFLSKPIEIAKLDEIMAKWIPAEKQIKTNGQVKRENSTEDTAPPAGAALVIPGVDVQKGITMTGGTEAGYRKVLAQFYKDAQARLPLLENAPEEPELSAFTTQAHALKSAAGTIGAAEVSSLAAELEAVGKAGDRAAVMGKLPLFRDNLTGLIEGIGKVMNSEQGTVDSGQNFDRLLFTRNCSQLKAALETKNMREFYRLLEEIEKIPLDAKTREKINVIGDKVLMGDYQGAMELVDRLSGKGP